MQATIPVLFDFTCDLQMPWLITLLYNDICVIQKYEKFKCPLKMTCLSDMEEKQNIMYVTGDALLFCKCVEGKEKAV